MGMGNLKPVHTPGLIEAGCDEAGRGCLAGPVFAAAVILPPDFYDSSIDDSKKLTLKQRLTARELIQHYALDWAVARVSNEEIDRLNILNASILAMHMAIKALTRATPQHLLIDGNRFKDFAGIPHTCIVGGDHTYQSIAAASILAKTYRDELMNELSEQYPDYGWRTNKGYPTKLHRRAIAALGPTPYHRLTFALLPQPKAKC